MKSLLLRLWQWLGRLLGQDTRASDELRTTNGESGTTGTEWRYIKVPYLRSERMICDKFEDLIALEPVGLF